jgi:hypothetical protein
LPALEMFLPTLPDDLRFAIEVRQSRWMTSARLRTFGDKVMAVQHVIDE